MRNLCRLQESPPAVFSQGAVNVLVKAGFPISKKIKDCNPLAKELFIALPDEDTGKYKFNDNFLGLENTPEVLNFFRNFVTKEGRNNYLPFGWLNSLRNNNFAGDSQTIADLRDCAWDRSLNQNMPDSVFRTDDMEIFINKVIEGDIKAIDDFFILKPYDRKKAGNLCASIDEMIFIVNKLQPRRSLSLSDLFTEGDLVIEVIKLFSKQEQPGQPMGIFGGNAGVSYDSRSTTYYDEQNPPEVPMFKDEPVFLLEELLSKLDYRSSENLYFGDELEQDWERGLNLRSLNNDDTST